MLRNYFKIAWRNIIRNKFFSAINILGLALGMACSLLIMLWVKHECSIDRYHRNGPMLYNVMSHHIHNGKISTGDNVPGPLAEELKIKFPEIVASLSFAGGQTLQMTFAAGEKIDKEQGNFASEDWFKVFSIPLLSGTPTTALNSPDGLVISRRLAEKYFGTPEQAIGKSIRIDAKKDYLVTAVFENLPDISSRKYDFLLSWQDCINRNKWMTEWYNNGPKAFIQLRPDANVAQLQAKLKHFLRAYNKQLNSTGFDVELFLQPYGDGYLYSYFKDGHQDGGRIEYVRLFTIVAIFLLLIACINFMNLATATSVKRAREVGVRKVMGAVKGLLAGQFAGEALLYTLLALTLALTMVLLLLPVFNTLSGKDLQLPFKNAWFWFTVAGMTLITAAVAGSYPALFLSSLSPASVLKGGLKLGTGTRRFRQGLVIFQFMLSMLLITGTFIVYRQINFIQSKNLGYDRENLIYLIADGDLASNKFEIFKEELLGTPGIQSVSAMENNLTNSTSSTNDITWTGKDPNFSVDFNQFSVSYNFVKTAGMSLAAGRDFSAAFGTDSTGYLINETALRVMGYQHPIGQMISLWGKPGRIIGVVKDFHALSLHSLIRPMILYLGTDHDHILVRTKPGQTQMALADMERLYRRLNPGFPMSYHFVDTEYEKQYRSEATIGQLAKYFACIAIFISCLGLLGLSAFMAEQRTKEIGVRKVLGASVQHVFAMLSKDVLKLVSIAIILVTPLAWYAMNQWLQNFAYKIDISWWMFAISGLLTILIAFFAISYQSIKAALISPLKSLRSD